MVLLAALMVLAMQSSEPRSTGLELVAGVTLVDARVNSGPAAHAALALDLDGIVVNRERLDALGVQSASANGAPGESEATPGQARLCLHVCVAELPITVTSGPGSAHVAGDFVAGAAGLGPFVLAYGDGTLHSDPGAAGFQPIRSGEPNGRLTVDVCGIRLRAQLAPHRRVSVISDRAIRRLQRRPECLTPSELATGSDPAGLLATLAGIEIDGLRGPQMRVRDGDRPQRPASIDLVIGGADMRPFDWRFDRRSRPVGLRLNGLPRAIVHSIGLVDVAYRDEALRVTAVEQNAPAGRPGGLRPGDVILSLNGLDARTSEAALRAIATIQYDRPREHHIRVRRGTAELELVIATTAM